MTSFFASVYMTACMIVTYYITVMYYRVDVPLCWEVQRLSVP